LAKGNVGFIGLGIMGKPMAKNLLKACYHLAVYNRSAKSVDELVALGAERMSSSKQVAENSDVIITMLPDGPDVEQAILGPAGVLEGLRKGAVVIDMSSISPLVAEKVAAEVEKKGGEMLDAPVSGGESGAIQGTLAIMVGGKRDVYNKCLPTLSAMGKNITLVGGAGAGQIAKLANQIVVAINIAGLSEALVFAAKLGIDPEILIRAIRGGLAGSAIMENKVPLIISRNFTPGFRTRLHQKDLRNALSTAAEYNIPLPLTSFVQQILNALVNDGKGELDHSAIVLSFENLAKTQAKKMTLQ
jgi:2-hydroxy-3-oxopropionate reductase